MEKDFSALSSYYPIIEKLTDLICKNKINEAKNTTENGTPYRKIINDWCGLEPDVFFHVCACITDKYFSGLSNGISHIKIVAESRSYSGKLFYSSVDTQFGRCVISLTEHGLCGVDFSEDEEKTTSEIIRKWPNCIPEKSDTKINEIRNQIFTNKAMPTDIIKVHLIGTEFQIMVWKTIARIPSKGKISYSEIASEIGKPNAARAVGNAVGKNPLGYLIPCHRVMPKSGSLGGFSGGPAKKLAMLIFETSRR